MPERKKEIMKNLIIDAVAEKIFLTLIVDENIYTSQYENSKSNFERLVILVNKLLIDNKISINEVKKIYVNRGPGSFAGIRNSLSVVKALHLTKKIDYYSFSFLDFDRSSKIKYEDVPNLCKKYKIKKNLIKPLFLS